jgi:hypothetical protein
MGMKNVTQRYLQQHYHVIVDVMIIKHSYYNQYARWCLAGGISPDTVTMGMSSASEGMAPGKPPR